ncbi:hypothetical protein MKX08_008730 [Trichoderma sp. CBMAI-0020]|nr:hypothetical protein MKX08_008730 [Trichoderma sp. CBMAI-0020]
MKAQGNIHVVAVKIVEFVKQILVCGHEEGNFSQNDISLCKIFCCECTPASKGRLVNSEEVVFELYGGRIFPRGDASSIFGVSEVAERQGVSEMAERQGVSEMTEKQDVSEITERQSMAQAGNPGAVKAAEKGSTKADSLQTWREVKVR